VDEFPRPIPWLLPGESQALPGLASAPPASVSPASVPLTPVSRARVHLPLVQSTSARPAPRNLRFSNWLGWTPRRSIGSKVPPRRIILALLWGRRLSQGAFLLLFFFLLTQTAFRGSFSAQNEQVVRLPYVVEAFLLADPFVAALTVLATHTLYAGLAWSFAVLGLTLVFGRAFCGWICPFGTIHHIVSYLWPSRALKGKVRVDSNKTKPWQVAKYYIMIGLLGAAAAGSALGGLLDPICIAVRAIGLGVLPALQYIGMGSFESLAMSDNRSVQQSSDAALDLLSSKLWTPEQAYFHQTWLILLSFLAIVALNRVVPRFWCRALCPLGAMLGVLSRFSLLGMEKDHSKCTDCNLCLVHCQGADSPQGGVKHRKDECHLCFNCEVQCPEDVIKFKWFPQLRSVQDKPDLQRRSGLASAAAGAVLIPAARIANWPDKAYNPKVIRPPGAVEEKEFLERCIRCAECMKVCPNNALHPAFFEAGPEGMWTPILIPRIGYCEHSCVLCGQVCPTGAISKIEEAQKLGVGEKAISIGTAMFDRGRCLPWAMATPCTVCEEFCPTSPKAIWLEEVQVPARAGASAAGDEDPFRMVTVKRPHMDPSLCIGCGACEKVCPVVDQPAVYVTSAGESRSRTNLILLEDTAYSAG
jgi:polyferredoxin